MIYLALAALILFAFTLGLLICLAQLVLEIARLVRFLIHGQEA